MRLDNRARLNVVVIPKEMTIFPYPVPLNGLILSDRVVREDLFTSYCVEQFEDVFNKTKRQWINNDVPNAFPGHLTKLDENGLIKVGSAVSFDDILVGVTGVNEVYEASDIETKLLMSIFGDRGRKETDDSLRYFLNEPGMVVNVSRQQESVRLFKDPVAARVKVDVAVRRELKVGDVLRDNNGGRFTVVRILSEREMPRFGGESADCVVHHSSSLVPQLHRTGFFSYKKSRRKSFGDSIKFEKETVLLEQKLVARSIGPYSKFTCQPLGNGWIPGQFVSRQAAEALFKTGLATNLREMFTAKSDSVGGRSDIYTSIIGGNPVPINVALPENSWRLISLTMALGLAFEPMDAGCEIIKLDALDSLGDRTISSIRFRSASQAEMLEWSHGEVSKPETINYRTFKPEVGGLFCQQVFGPVSDYECACGRYKRMKHKGIVCEKCRVEVCSSKVRFRRFGHIQLVKPVVRPWCIAELPSRLGLPEDVVKGLVYHFDEGYKFMVTKCDQEFISQHLGEITEAVNNTRLWKDVKKVWQTPGDAQTGLALLPSLQKHQLVELHEARALGKVRAIVLEVLGLNLPLSVKTGTAALESLLRQKGYSCDDYLLYVLPVLPAELRPLVPLDNGRFASSDLNDLYRRVINRNNRLKKLMELNSPDVIIRNEERMMQEAIDALFDNSGKFSRVLKGCNDRPLKALVDDWQTAVSTLTQKRTDYSAQGAVVPDDSIGGSQIGLPLFLVHELFKPFLYRALMEMDSEQFKAVKLARLFMTAYPDSPLLAQAVQQVLPERKVIVRSADNAITVLSPVLIDGDAVAVHPETARDLQLQFNGDKLTLYLPMSDEAVKESFNPAPSQEIQTTLSDLTPEGMMQWVWCGASMSLTPFDKTVFGVN